MYKTLTVLEISICIKNLFLINTIFLYIAVYLSILVNTLEIFLLNLRYIYSLIELIIKIFATIYINLNATIEIKELIDLSI